MARIEHDPYSIRWDLGVQHQWGSKTVGQIAYIANHGVHIPVAAIQLNPVPAQYLSTSPVRDPTSQANSPCAVHLGGRFVF